MQSVRHTTLRGHRALAAIAVLALAITMLVALPSSADEECLADAEGDVLDRVTGRTVTNPRADLASICAEHRVGRLTLQARFVEASDIATYPAWEPGRSALVFEVRTNPGPEEGADVDRDYDVIVGRAGTVAGFTVRHRESGETTCNKAIPDELLPTADNPQLTIAFDPTECIPDTGAAPITVAVAGYLFFAEQGGNPTIDEVPPSAVGYGSVLDTNHRPPAGFEGVLRMDGADRVATAIKVSGALFPDDATNRAGAAVIATSQNFADAVSAAPLAVRFNGPLLLSQTASRLSDPVEAELQRVLAAGSTVYLVGGGAVLSDDIALRLAELGYTPQRLGGEGRHETALEVARAIDPNPARVVLADGGAYQLPLLGATYAAATNNLRTYGSGEATRIGGNAVLLLTGGPDAYRQALTDYLGADPNRAGREYVAIGSLAAAFADASGLAVSDANRLMAEGDDPFTTANLVAARFDGANAIDPPAPEPAPADGDTSADDPAEDPAAEDQPTDPTFAQTDDATGDQSESDPSDPDQSDPDPPVLGTPRPVRAIDPPSFVTVSTATSFADAVPGATLAGVHGAPLLFAWRDTVPQATRATLAGDGFTNLRLGFVMGGTAALGDRVAEQVSTCLRGAAFSSVSCQAG